MRWLLTRLVVMMVATVIARPGLAQSVLSITKIDTPDPVVAGNLLTYTMTASNAGPDAALNLTISDPLPSRTLFISAVASPGATLTTPTVGVNGTVTAVWNAAGGVSGGLTAVGVNRTLTVVVRVCPDAGCDDLDDTATVSADGTTSQMGSSKTTVSSVGDLSISVDGPAEALRGSAVTYTLAVQNTGPSVLTDALVVYELAPGLAATAVETTFTDAFCAINPEKSIVTCAFAIGAANQCSTTYATSGTVTVKATVLPSAQSGDGHAGVLTDGECGSDTNPANNFAIVSLLVTGATAPALGGLGLAALATLLAVGGALRLGRRVR